MKRDCDCVKAILLALEEREDTKGVIRPNEISGWSEETVSYHIWLLEQAGLILATCQQIHPNSKIFCLARLLTWNGHELLDKLKSDMLWRRIVATARDRSIELSFEAVNALAAKMILG